MGERAVAGADEDRRVAPPGVLLGQPVGHGSQVDVAQAGGVDALRRADPGVDLPKQRPGQVPAGADRSGIDRRLAEMWERLTPQAGAERREQCGGRVEEGDRVGRLEVGQRRTRPVGAP